MPINRQAPLRVAPQCIADLLQDRVRLLPEPIAAHVEVNAVDVYPLFAGQLLLELASVG